MTQIFKLAGSAAARAKVLKRAASLLKRGAIGVLPTDTLYGIVARAFDKQAVLKTYRLRNRQPAKPFIILISSVRDLNRFDTKSGASAANLLARIWPGKVSVILPCNNPDLKYLHRGTNSLAFRLPDDHQLRSLLKQTGPLIAPSANPEGLPPALTIAEAQKYFGKKLEFYVDAGVKKSLPSTLIKIEDGKVAVLRRGAKKIK